MYNLARIQPPIRGHPCLRFAKVTEQEILRFQPFSPLGRRLRICDWPAPKPRNMLQHRDVFVLGHCFPVTGLHTRTRVSSMIPCSLSPPKAALLGNAFSCINSLPSCRDLNYIAASESRQSSFRDHMQFQREYRCCSRPCRRNSAFPCICSDARLAKTRL